MRDDTVKCVSCGRFLSLESMKNGKAKFHFEPDSDRGTEISEWTCAKCDQKMSDSYLNRTPKPFLDFDDAGASDDEPVKGITIGDVRAWHDQYDMLLSSWAQCRDYLSKERAATCKLTEVLAAIRKFSECGMSVMAAAECLDSITAALPSENKTL